MDRLCGRTPGWRRMAAFAPLLAPLLTLAACGSQDSSFSADLHGTPNEVLGAIDEPALAQVTSYIPEARIIRSRPSDSEVLYTMPGEKPGAQITVKFTLSPLANGEGTRLVTDLHVPDVTMNFSGVKKIISKRMIQKEMERTVNNLAERLNDGRSTLATRREMGGLMAALAIASHPTAVERLSSASGRAELERRLMGGMYYWSGDSGLAGYGQAPMPTRIRPDMPVPDSIPMGTDPNPTISGGDAARPMIRPTGTNPNPYY